MIPKEYHIYDEISMSDFECAYRLNTMTGFYKNALFVSVIHMLLSVVITCVLKVELMPMSALAPYRAIRFSINLCNISMRI